ncbi:MAG: hypothetical protein QM666_08520 [Acinetobacter sp.]
MSYKHNNLMAMRNQYWQDNSLRAQQEKAQLKIFLSHTQLFEQVGESELKYFFYCLPSAIIMKGYALGFNHPKVIHVMKKYIIQNKSLLKCKAEIKIQYRFQ